MKKQIIMFVVFSLAIFTMYGCSGQATNPNDASAENARKNGNNNNGKGTPGKNRPNNPLNKYMLQAEADALGISSDDLQARLGKGEKLEDIAQAKGWTQDDLRTKMSDIITKAVDAALKDGAITQQQADAYKQRGAGVPNGGPRPDGGRGMGPMDEYTLAATAEVLGVTTTDLQTRITAGENPMDMVRKQGLSFEDYRTKLEAALTKVLNQAVTDGKLTQQDADQKLQQYKERPGPGGRGPQGNPPDGTPGNPPDAPQGNPPDNPQAESTQSQ